MQLTEEQAQATRESARPIRLTDPETQAEYVLVRAELFDRLRELLEGDDELAEVRAMYPHIWEVMREDWDDPAMDVYDTQLPDHS